MSQSQQSGTPRSQSAAPQQKSAGWVFRTLFLLALGGTGLVAVVGGAFYWHISRDLPNIIAVTDYRPPIATRILGGNGKEEELLGEFFFENERRYLVPEDKLPKLVTQAFIAAEDETFYSHPGFNLASIVGAAIANFRAGHNVRGASTITQQVAKKLLLTSEKSYDRKIKELILASRFERNLSKQDILYLYLNHIYLGHGAYGIQAAAKTYFSKDVSQLSLPEAAILAGLPPAPADWDPLKNPKKAKERQSYVLGQMVKSGYITAAQAKEASDTRLRLYGDEDTNAKYAAHFVEYVRRYLLDKYGDKALYGGGLTVSVPVTRELSLAATKSLKDGLRTLDKRIGYRGPIRKLKAEEFEAFEKDLKLRLIEKKLGYVVMMPDGRIDAIEAMRESGVETEGQLLDKDEIYQGVVTRVDDQRKIAEVSLGSTQAVMTMENMKWAKPYREGGGWRPEPNLPSKVVAKGDVIEVKYIGVPEKAADKTPQVALEQEPQVQGAVFSIDSKTGYVLAMEGGYDFKHSQFNRVTQAQRQPGSAFKPIIYAAGLERGYTPASIIVDSPLVLDENSDTGKWKPTNFEEKFYGDTTYRQALIKSRNIPTIKIVQNIQIPHLIDYARRLGFSSQFNPDLSISLGSTTVSLMEITKVYALFPRLGRRVTPIFISKVVDRDGKVLEENIPQPLAPPRVLPATPVAPDSPEAKPATPGGPVMKIALPSYPPADDPDQVLDPRVAYVMSHIMTEVVNYGTGYEAKALGRPAAGKTGTTNEYNDAWFMGFTPDVVTGTWVGYDNQKSMGPGETGARAALPIWLNFMREAVKPYPESDFTVPPGVVFASIDAATGKSAPSNSSRSIREAFIEGTQPLDNADPSGAEATDTQTDFFKEDVQ